MDKKETACFIIMQIILLQERAFFTPQRFRSYDSKLYP